MKAAIKDLWVDEGLLSGNYTQVNGAFRALIEDPKNGGECVGSCCLAVLTDLAIKSGEVPDVRWWGPNNESVLVRVEPDGDYSVVDLIELDDGFWIEHEDGDLPKPVMEWAGLTSPNPLIDEVKAVERNDQLLETFEQIAEAIKNDDTL